MALVNDWAFNSVYNYMIWHIEGSDKDFYKKKYLKFIINDFSVFFNKKLVIYGAGNVGKTFYMQLCPYSQIDIVGWVDKNYNKCQNDYRTVEPVEYIFSIDFDLILIAVQNKDNAILIRNNLLEKGVSVEKILWINPITGIDNTILISGGVQRYSGFIVVYPNSRFRRQQNAA